MQSRPEDTVTVPELVRFIAANYEIAGGETPFVLDTIKAALMAICAVQDEPKGGISENGVALSAGEPRKPAKRRKSRAIPGRAVYHRAAIVRIALREFCEARDITVADLIKTDCRDEFMVQARQDFCQLARRLGAGSIITADVLGVSSYRVRFWRSAELRTHKRERAKHVRRERRERERNAGIGAAQTSGADGAGCHPAG